MCAGCAITAAASATGFRTWLQSSGFGWLTPRRLKALTAAAMSAAALVSTVGLSGSSAAGPHHAAPAAHQQDR